MADLQAALADARDIVANVIDAQPSFGPAPLDDAMRYALEGGKGLRAFLVLEGAGLHGPEHRLRAGHAAAAIECIHAYSLIHDDLPCMDDDDLRRGRPTVHKKWDEATAVLAGDALQTAAFGLIAGAALRDDVTVRLMESLSIAAGYMVSGQMLDMMAERSETPLSLAEAESLQWQKTGALLHWSAVAGALHTDATTKHLDAYGRAIGRAFQIADDILDVEGDADTVGKAVRKDANAGKATFVSLLGLDGAKRRANELVQEACDALSPYGDDAETLKEAARFVIARTH
ncbi:polyprenyl synthetase family protein [Yoonia sp. BS5-3]|uniref:Polyprenyl synthetase family protein n=1 Tax=Yoonia phaeophyticola TaxID=3137369 RepID=A0ABZ2V988_9RHOB